MDKYEAIDLLGRIMPLLEKKKYGTAMKEIGMDLSLFDETQSLPELMEVFQVRFSDLCKLAGVRK